MVFEKEKLKRRAEKLVAKRNGVYNSVRNNQQTYDVNSTHYGIHKDSKQESKDTFSSKLADLTPRARFRRAARQVKVICTVQIILNRYVAEAGRSSLSATLPDLAANMSASPSVVYIPSTIEKVTFNAEEFKSNYEFTWPKKDLKAVDKRPNDRTDADIRLIGSMMRGLHSFRKYTRAHQQLICRVVRLQKYGRRRVVVRKGHLGYAFYFIFSGAACVTLDEDEASAFVKKEVTILRKGACFGEIALMKNTRRMATVVCLQDTELLVVDRDDFIDKGLYRHIQAEFEYKYTFLRKLDLFSSWSDDKLEEVSDLARIEEYNHDSVIVKDSRETHWLLFVTKGRCDVLKLVDLAKVYAAKNEENSAQSHKQGAGVSSLLSGDYPLSLLPEGQRSSFPWQTPHRLPVNTRPKTTGQIHCKSKNKMLTDAQLNHQRSKSAGVKYNEDAMDLDIPSNSCSRSTFTSGLSFSKRRSCDPVTPLKLPDHISLGIATMKGDGVEAGVYIRVDSLRSGQCFGLEGILDDMPKYSLLSHGCEIVRVSMSKFREYACDKTLAKLQKLIPTYPSDQFLWSSFLKQSRWNNFKTSVVEDVIDEAQSRSTPSTFARNLRSSRGRSKSLNIRFGSGITSHISNLTSTWVDDRSSCKSRYGFSSQSRFSKQQTTRPVSHR